MTHEEAGIVAAYPGEIMDGYRSGVGKKLPCGIASYIICNLNCVNEM